MYNVGACVGSLGAVSILNKGRRRALFIAGMILIGAAVLEQFMYFWSMFFSRVIAGLGAGIVMCATSRIIEEYVPLAMYSTASPFNIFMGQLGSFLALLSAIALPPSKAPAIEYAENTSWHYMFGMTFVWLTIGLLGMTFLVRTDTPKFYISK